MKTSISKPKVIAAVSTILLFTAIGGLFYMDHTKRSLKDLFDASRLNSEKLLSEKLGFEKDALRLDKELNKANKKNASTEKLLAETNEKLKAKERELNKKWADKSRMNALQSEVDELRNLRNSLESQLAAMETKIKSLADANTMLSQSVSTITESRDLLQHEYEILTALTANNYRVDATRGKKDKLTIKARSARSLKLGFDVPLEVVESINFRINTPAGKVISSADESVAIEMIEDGTTLLASTEEIGIDIFKVSKRIEMTYLPKEKLKAGIYKIDVYNKDLYMGSCQVRLK